MYKLTTDILLQVRELLGRNLEAYEIAHRLHMDIGYVKQAMVMLGS
jgi:hypothetical protein